MKVNGVKHIRVAPYNVACNGMGVGMVQSFKNPMKACKGSKLSIQQHTAKYLLTYWSTRHPTTDITPVGPFQGRELRIRLTFKPPKCLGKADAFTSKAESNT